YEADINLWRGARECFSEVSAPPPFDRADRSQMDFRVQLQCHHDPAHALTSSKVPAQPERPREPAVITAPSRCERAQMSPIAPLARIASRRRSANGNKPDPRAAPQPRATAVAGRRRCVTVPRRWLLLASKSLPERITAITELRRQRVSGGDHAP